MQTFHNRKPDVLALAAATWLAIGLVLLLLTPMPAHDAQHGWSIAFWLIVAPAAVLAARFALSTGHTLSPVRLRSIRRRNSRITRR